MAMLNFTLHGHGPEGVQDVCTHAGVQITELILSGLNTASSPSRVVAHHHVLSCMIKRHVQILAYAWLSVYY